MSNSFDVSSRSSFSTWDLQDLEKTGKAEYQNLLFKTNQIFYDALLIANQNSEIRNFVRQYRNKQSSGFFRRESKPDSYNIDLTTVRFAKHEQDYYLASISYDLHRENERCIVKLDRNPESFLSLTARDFNIKRSMERGETKMVGPFNFAPVEYQKLYEKIDSIEHLLKTNEILPLGTRKLI